ncbi:MAG: TIGR03749 family integrating conjugative element protein [Woeseia sp.]
MSFALPLNPRLIMLVAGLFVLAHTAYGESAAPQRVLWDKLPVTVTLTAGEERMVHFRAPVSVGVPAGLESLLRTQTVNGTVYLLANTAFPKTRIVVRELDGGQVYLLDVSATADGGPSDPITVVIDESNTRHDSSGQNTNGHQHGYVSLTRYAAQQLYAPVRLLSAEPGIVRQPVRQVALELVPGNRVEAMPLAAWRAGSLYVTAVKLTNRGKKAQLLDPRTLRGHWLSATFQHARLLPAGDDADTTAVYLVSARPFEESL